MNNILVVEDEKMIRKGIVAMIQRIAIPVAEIIEAKNGEEAMEIIKQIEIDVMITDIRMPKMDGITLVKNIRELEKKPQIIVVSGYDDFNYVVEVLRQGVRDYLLKPIEREKLEKILRTIESEILVNHEQQTIAEQIGNQQLKYLLLNQNITDIELDIIEKQSEYLFSTNKYVVCCFRKSDEYTEFQNCMGIIEDMEDNQLLIVTANDLDNLMQTELQNRAVGISKSHMGVCELSKAYREALYARKEAFVKCTSFVVFEETTMDYELIPENFSEQFVQQFGSGKVEEVLTKLGNIRFKAKMNKIASETLLEITNQILFQLLHSYERMMEFDMQEFEKLKNPLAYQNANDYYQLFEKWMKNMQQIMTEEFDDYKNKEKITIAIQYIHDNYQTDLNMAVVSNHISMNYSLFSLNFKQYTGMNFVNYLKKIRIEEAKRLLEYSEEKIIDISQMVGYDNDKHFMKTFKSVCGVSPSEYRKNCWIMKREF